VRWAQACTNDAAGKMRTLYEKNHVRNTLIQKGLDVACKMNWENFKKQWINQINETINKKPFLGILT
jgi:hypothetical protein